MATGPRVIDRRSETTVSKQFRVANTGQIAMTVPIEKEDGSGKSEIFVMAKAAPSLAPGYVVNPIWLRTNPTIQVREV